MDWRNKFDQIENKVKFQLNAKGVDTVIALEAWMQKYDVDNSGALNKVEFNNFLNSIGAFVTTQELRTVFDMFDLNKDGQIHYQEFLNTLRANMAHKRLAVVKHAFQFLDQSGSGKLCFENLCKIYDANAHPRVRTREKRAETVRHDFEVAMGARAQGG